MAMNDKVKVEPGSWVQLTNGNATNITIIHEGGGSVRLEGTVGAVAPAASAAENGLPLEAKDYGFINYALTDLFPHVTGANRVYAWTDGRPVHLLVKHA